MLNSRCTVCHHPRQHDIDRALLFGCSLTSLARQYHLSTSALHRHHVHLKKHLAKARVVLQDQHREHLLANLAVNLERLHRVADAAFRFQDRASAIQSTREIKSTLKLMQDFSVPLHDLGVYDSLISAYSSRKDPAVSTHRETNDAKS